MNINSNLGHPGPYVKQNVIPQGLSVTDAARQLGVGRPALSNFLNGKASLSPEMATRLEKAFGANRKKLLDMQAAYSGNKQATGEQPVVVRGYIPPVLQVKAKQINAWADNIEARNELAALLRRLVNSTSADIHAVDFPAFDNAERSGWDGTVDTCSPTPWVPAGKSGWEFGCNKDMKKKANNDYNARTRSVPENERADTVFVFVTPRNWPGKKEWVETRKEEGWWKDVRAYDASDLEQWLEISVPAQIWLSESINALGINVPGTNAPDTGYRSLEYCWSEWANASNPALSDKLFAPAVNSFINIFSDWLQIKADRPFVIAAESSDEALAFLRCMMEDPELEVTGNGDNVIVVDTPEALKKLASASEEAFVAVTDSEEVERALAGFHRRFHCIIVRPRNRVSCNKPGIASDITLDLLSWTDFQIALKDMKIDENEAQEYDRESGRSPTILHRRLSNISAIRQPHWARDHTIASDLIPAALAGSWKADTEADRKIISRLANVEYSVVEEHIARIIRMEDAPLWSIGKCRGVTSRTEALFAIAPAITEQHLDRFFNAAESVLSETHLVPELPEDQRPSAAFYGQVCGHSSFLRDGICDTLILLAVHGKTLFFERLGMNAKASVDALIRQLLTTPSIDALYSNNHDLPKYAEAAPEVFLELVEKDLRSSNPIVLQLLKSADSSLFGGDYPRTDLLWALECLAWKPEYLPHVTRILAGLSAQRIDDNRTSRSKETLKSIFWSRMPQTAASVKDRIKVIKCLAKRQPKVVWDICAEQFGPGSRIRHYNYRPRWRDDASGVGQPVGDVESSVFACAAVDICLDWPEHDKRTLVDLVERLEVLSEENRERVWDLIDEWADRESREEEKAELREHIRCDVLICERSRAAMELLAPKNPILRHKWLFVSEWVQQSQADRESVDLNYGTHKRRVLDQRAKSQRTNGLKEIWEARGFEGIRELLKSSRTHRLIGSIMADLLQQHSQRTGFIKECLEGAEGEIKPAIQDCLYGFLRTISEDSITEILDELGGELTDDQLVMMFLSMSFGKSTWGLLADQAYPIGEGYWKNVNASWNDPTYDEVNEVIDKLLEADRPADAVHAVRFWWKNIETRRLVNLLDVMAMKLEAAPELELYRLAKHDILGAFEVLDKRSGVSVQKKAFLEFMYFEKLEHSEYGTPNFEKQIAASPELYVQAIHIAFSDGEKHRRVVNKTFRLLNRLRRIPGTDKDGTVEINDLKKWLSKVREGCRQYGCADIGDKMIGQLLSRSKRDEDGNWPSRPICEALEWLSCDHVGIGFKGGTRNSRGVYSASGGDQERELADRYESDAQRVVLEFPCVNRLLKSIANSYKHDAEWEDIEAKVRSRIPY